MIETLGNLDVTKPGAKVSKLDPSGIPGFAPLPKGSWNPQQYRIKYKRVNAQTEDDMGELERIETAAIRDEGIYILNKERFIFMDQIIILVQYLERIEE